MVIISRLEFIPNNPVKYPCQIFYKRDGDITSKNKYRFENKDGEYLLLDGYYSYCNYSEEYFNKAVNLETGKEVYFEDLVKTNNPPKPQIKEVVKKKVSFWDKIKSWFK